MASRFPMDEHNAYILAKENQHNDPKLLLKEKLLLEGREISVVG